MAAPRSWRRKFAEAFRGVWLVARGESSFRVQSVVAALVVVAAAVFGCDRVEWCLLIVCIGVVLAAEAFNAALETLFHALDAATKQRMTGCLDRTAGAVLLTAIAAGLIGVLVLGHRAAVYLGWSG